MNNERDEYGRFVGCDQPGIDENAVGDLEAEPLFDA